MGTATVGLAGGALIGVGAALLLLLNGRLGAIGGIVAGLFQRSSGEWAWRAMFVLGLVFGGLLLVPFAPSSFVPSPTSGPVLFLAGVAVGFGARLGGGCTSGHGVCGVSRFSKRSIVATITFIVTGAVVVALVRIFGGAP